jgi:hypothetical protein
MILAHTDTTRLFMYTLYEKPRDYPGYYVLRKSFQVRSTITMWLSIPDDVLIARSPEIIHAIMRIHSFAWLDRSPEDDPVIMGVYM